MKKTIPMMAILCLANPAFADGLQGKKPLDIVASVKASTDSREVGVGVGIPDSGVRAKIVKGVSTNDEDKDYFGLDFSVDFLDDYLTGGISARTYADDNECVTGPYAASCNASEASLSLGANVYDDDRFRVQPYLAYDLIEQNLEGGVNAEVKFKLLQ